MTDLNSAGNIFGHIYERAEVSPYISPRVEVNSFKEKTRGDKRRETRDAVVEYSRRKFVRARFTCAVRNRGVAFLKEV